MRTLWTSWISLRSRALNSRNPKTAEDARRIDQNPTGVLRGLQESLRKGEFRFRLQRGVLQRRKGKKPRPIVVSPVTNRIVQRAILEILQDQSPSVIRRLGDIPGALRTRTSVGGIPGKGASDGVQLISAAISSGATHYIRSDIVNFFTKIPTAQLIQLIRDQTGDDEFAHLIQTGLNVELENACDPTVSEWIDLFPNGEIGVPQGSSLSAFCANYVLRRFDAGLNGPSLTTIRYIDDFVILGGSETAVHDAWVNALEFLDELGLEAHMPELGGTKASQGTVSDGFDFLSYRFYQGQTGLSRDAKKRLLQEIDAEIRAAKHSIQTSWTEPRRAEPRFAQALAHLDRKVRGWGDSFRDVNQRVEFNQLDDKIMTRMQAFIGWYTSRVGQHTGKEKMRGLGVALLEDTPRQQVLDDFTSCASRDL
ncbi:MAG: reverse transcriptase domain-containing protein [Defluviicoccus sp.]|nr:reverse transcriptase domain-containing protein [Defluviicoccus sp.]